MRPIACAAACLLLACGGSPSPSTQTPATATANASAEDEPESRSVLGDQQVPALPEARERLSVTLREGLDQARDAWERIRDFPDGPERRTTRAIERWTEGPFKRWIRQSRDRLVVATRTLEHVSEHAAEKAVAAGVLAFLYERFVARFVNGVPIPETLADNAKLRGTYVRGLDRQARPLVDEALGFYSRCVQQQGSAIQRWHSFCKRRRASLAERWKDRGDGS